MVQPTPCFNPWDEAASVYKNSLTMSNAFAAARLIEVAHTDYLPFVPHQETASSDQTADEIEQPQSSSVLDVGAGAGAATITFAKRFPHIPILATDVAPKMLQELKSSIPPSLYNVKTQVLDGKSLSKNLLSEKSSGSPYSHIICTFALHCDPQPDIILREIYEVLRPSGVFCTCSYQNIDHLDIYRAWVTAVRTIDPSYALPLSDEAYKDSLTRSSPNLAKAIEVAGFHDVKVEENCRMPISFESGEAFADLWFSDKVPALYGVTRPYLEGKTDEEVARVKEAVAKVVREDYGDGKDMAHHAFLVWGRK